MATRELRLDHGRVRVIIGKPQPFPPATGLGHFCRSRIDGLRDDPVELCATGTQPTEALVSGLSMLSDTLGITLVDLLSDTHVADGRRRARPADKDGNGDSPATALTGPIERL